MAKTGIKPKENKLLFNLSKLDEHQESPGSKIPSNIALKLATREALEEIKFHVLLESAPDAIVTIDEKDVIKHWNLKAEKIFGWKQEEIRGMKYSETIIPERFRKEHLKGLKNFLRTGTATDLVLIKQLEIPALKKDQSEFSMDLRVSAINLENKYFFICFIRDITERKEVKNNILENEELYRTVVESLSEGLVITNNEDIIIFVNSKMENLTGYTKEEMAGKTAYELFLSQNNSKQFTERMEMRLAGIFESYELKISRKDGSYFLGHVNAVPYRNSNGEITGTVGAITDITFSKREEELEKLAIAATKSRNSVVIADKNGRIEWVNEGFTQLSGYDLKDILGTSGEALRKGNQTGFSPQTSFYESIVKEKKPVTYENKNFTKEGREYWSITTLTPVLDEHGEVDKIVAIDSDITQRKNMEKNLIIANEIAENSLHKSNQALDELLKAKKQLEESAKVKEQFLAHMSHEIHTPMNGVIGLTEILLKTGLTSIQREYLTAIKASCSTLLGAIDNILDVSKMEAKKMTFEEIPFKIPTIINSVLDLFYLKAKEKNIEIKKDIDASIPKFLLGDTLRLNQILMNLMSNAFKFTEKGQVKITVQLKNEDKDVALLEFKIKDTGKGIPPVDLNSIFMDFTQVSTDITTKYGRKGLGLAISKRLVELQGGEINVKSIVHLGSIFSVVLSFKKCKNEEELAGIMENENFSYCELIKCRILLVEDNVMNQMVAEKVLTDWKCIVDIAENGKVAIEKLTKNHYDIILMDIKMPEMDGFETTRYIRNKMNPPACNTSIIALTAHAATWEAEKCIESGMNDYISKPFDAKVLYKKLVRYAGGNRHKVQAQPDLNPKIG